MDATATSAHPWALLCDPVSVAHPLGVLARPRGLLSGDRGCPEGRGPHPTRQSQGHSGQPFHVFILKAQLDPPSVQQSPVSRGDQDDSPKLTIYTDTRGTLLNFLFFSFFKSPFLEDKNTGQKRNNKQTNSRTLTFIWDRGEGKSVGAHTHCSPQPSHSFLSVPFFCGQGNRAG